MSYRDLSLHLPAGLRLLTTFADLSTATMNSLKSSVAIFLVLTCVGISLVYTQVRDARSQYNKHVQLTGYCRTVL